jgi:hypothetical protein
MFGSKWRTVSVFTRVYWFQNVGTYNFDVILFLNSVLNSYHSYDHFLLLNTCWRCLVRFLCRVEFLWLPLKVAVDYDCKIEVFSTCVMLVPVGALERCYPPGHFLLFNPCQRCLCRFLCRVEFSSNHLFTTDTVPHITYMSLLPLGRVHVCVCSVLCVFSSLFLPPSLFFYTQETGWTRVLGVEWVYMSRCGPPFLFTIPP